MKFKRPGKSTRFAYIKKNDLINIKIRDRSEYEKHIFVKYDDVTKTLTTLPLEDNYEQEFSILQMIKEASIEDIDTLDNKLLLFMVNTKNKNILDVILKKK
jgi:hypothetical protein